MPWFRPRRAGSPRDVPSRPRRRVRASPQRAPGEVRRKGPRRRTRGTQKRAPGADPIPRWGSRDDRRSRRAGEGPGPARRGAQGPGGVQPAAGAGAPTHAALEGTGRRKGTDGIRSHGRRVQRGCVLQQKIVQRWWRCTLGTRPASPAVNTPTNTRRHPGRYFNAASSSSGDSTAAPPAGVHRLCHVR